MNSRRFRVSGRVQGVGFRAYCRQVALKHGLSGWAINRDDGSVDLLLCGDDAQLTAAQAAIAEGPPLARVTGMTPLDSPEQPPEGEFRVG